MEAGLFECDNDVYYIDYTEDSDNCDAYGACYDATGLPDLPEISWDSEFDTCEVEYPDEQTIADLEIHF